MNDFRDKVANMVEVGTMNIDTSIISDITRVCIICGESTGNQWDEVCPECKRAVMFIRNQIKEKK